MKKLTVILLIFLMVTALAACGGSSGSSSNSGTEVISQSTDQGQNGDQETHTIPEGTDQKAADFAVKLLQASNKSGENVLISPLSVMTALTMTANGADGETLEQMEAALGMPLEELNEYLIAYINNLPNSDKYKLDAANSIWFTSDDEFTVNEDFLKENVAKYGADIFKASFDDSTLKDINDWVDDKTEGMIPEILDQIDENAVMYLINALAFEAEWAEIYEDFQVQEDEFTAEDGTKEKVELMHSMEGSYLESDDATGMIKYYKDGKYAFAALLPNEGITVDELLGSLDGVKLHNMLAERQDKKVITAIPKFETSFDIEMSEALMGMGMTDAFDLTKADFTKLGTAVDKNIFINRVIHKTFISVAEQGTKAGAVTVVEMNAEGAMLEEEPPKEVILNRPFVYMLVDCETYTPFFIGTLMHAEGQN